MLNYYVSCLARLLVVMVIVLHAAADPVKESLFDTHFRSIGKSETTLAPILVDNRHLIKEEHLSEFEHAPFFFDAIAKGHTRLSVREKLSKDQARKLNKASGEVNYSSFDTLANYEMKGDIHSLDAVSHPEHVTELSDTHLRHCVRAPLAVALDAREGHIIVGSQRGSWFEGRHLESWTKSTKPHPHAHPTLILGRRVTRRVEDESGCVTLHTEPIHYFELFESFRLESLVDHPGKDSNDRQDSEATPPTSTQSPPPPPTPTTERNLQQLQAPTMINNGNGQPEPDVLPGTSPYTGNNIIPCDPPASNPWKDNGKKLDIVFSAFSTNPVAGVSYTSFSGSNLGADVWLRAQYGCASLSYTAKGINYNWDPDPSGDPLKGKVLKDSITIRGVQGISCDNCYVYAGAQFFAIFEYRPTFKLFAEVRLSGAAGFNVNVQITNPSVSGTTKDEIVAPGDYGKSIPLGGGLSLQLKPGGLSASVTGSGTVAASASFGAGLNVRLAFGVMLNNGDFSLPTTFKFDWIPPFFKMTSYTPSPATLNVALTAAEYVKISLGAAFLTASLDALVEITGNSGLGGPGSSATAAVRAEPFFVSAGRALKGSVKTVRPGDVIRIRYEYKGCVPGERHTLFYSATSRLTGSTHNIMQRDFFNSKSGAGVHVADWTVPSDTSFRGPDDGSNFLTFRVRSSTWIHDELAAVTDPVRVTAFTERDTIFKPSAALRDGAFLPVDKPFRVSWNPALLHYFDSPAISAPYHGKEEQTARVRFVLQGRAVDAGAHDVAFDLGGSFPNTGSATVVINSTQADLTVPRKYWLEVHDVASTAMGWSPGYQQIRRLPKDAALDPASQKYAATLAAPVAAAPTSPALADRQLDSCNSASNVPISSSLQVGGRPNELKLDFGANAVYKQDMPATASTQTVGTPQTLCSPLPAAGGGGGSGSGDGGGGGGGGAAAGVNNGGGASNGGVRADLLGGGLAAAFIFIFGVLAYIYVYDRKHFNSICPCVAGKHGTESTTTEQPSEEPQRMSDIYKGDEPIDERGFAHANPDTARQLGPAYAYDPRARQEQPSLSSHNRESEATNPLALARLSASDHSPSYSHETHDLGERRVPSPSHHEYQYDHHPSNEQHRHIHNPEGRDPEQHSLRPSLDEPHRPSNELHDPRSQLQHRLQPYPQPPHLQPHPHPQPHPHLQLPQPQPRLQPHSQPYPQQQPYLQQQPPQQQQRPRIRAPHK